MPPALEHDGQDSGKGKDSRRRPPNLSGWTVFDDIATVAYDRDGRELWVARFDGASDIDA